MKARKVLFLSLFVGMLGVSGSSNAGIFDIADAFKSWWAYRTSGPVIDDQSRRLKDHETYGNIIRGHTLLKHVNPSNASIVERCYKDNAVKNRHSTRYSTVNKAVRSSSESIRDVVEKNQQVINLFAKNRSTRSKFFGNLRQFQSYGLNCRTFNKSFIKTINFRGYQFKYYDGPVIRNYPHNIVRIKRKSNEKGGWYIYTSFPTYQAR